MGEVEYSISEHAVFEMERRQISLEQVMGVLIRPQQEINAGRGRQIYQSRYYDAIEGKEMLLRAVVEHVQRELRVVTVYKTSRIDRYWVRNQ